MPIPRTYRQLPPIQSGYPLAPAASWFSVVVPIARTNLVTNPSFETNTTSWTAIGGSIARSTTYQYHGAYSLAITPTATTTDGARYDTVSLASGTTYAYSAKVRGVAGLKYKIAVETTGGSELAAVTFTATGRWQWVYGYYKETSSTTRRITLRKAGHASTALFYVDGVQVEAIVDGELVSTYIDGDQVGLVPNQFPAPYVWNGTPHASTSTRSGQTRAGGTVMRLDLFGFILLTMVGLNVPTVNNVSVPYVQLDGGQFERTQKQVRQFTLAGQWMAPTFAQLQRQITSLTRVLDRDRVGQQQPLVLQYQGNDGCGRPTSDVARIVCSYAGGLEGQTDNLHAEQASIVFQQWLPNILSDGEIGAALTVQTSVANANRVVIRSSSGVWSAIGTGASGGGVYAVARGNNGTYYLGGAFTSFNGLANTRAVVQYDPVTGTISAMGTGATTGRVADLLVAPNGDIWAVGNFTDMGGIAAADFVARWDGAAWNAVGTPPVAVNTVNVTQATFGATGNFYYASGPSSTVRAWDGASWTTLGTVAGSTAEANCLLRLANGDLLVGGAFTSVNGVSATNIARYSFSAGAWQALSGSITEEIAALALAANGTVYAGTNNGTATLASLWLWNGSAWSRAPNVPVGGSVYTLGVRPDGTLAIGGFGFPAPSATMIDQIGIWNGSVTTPIDINLPGALTAEAYRIWTAADGVMVVGFSTTGTATSAGLTTVTNPGTANTYPTVTIKGPTSGTSRLYELVNITTGRSIYLNLTINAGETVTFRFTPDNLSFTSTFQGDVTSAILSGSTPANFFLQPGANTIAFFAADSSVTATLVARAQYNSVADLTP